ncbi:MAG: glycosyltransferase family 4 protein [Chryseolinea sp.]
MAIETLLVGGAELFAIRLANGMCDHYDVTLVVTNGHLISNDVLKQLDKRVTCIPISFPSETLLRYFGRILQMVRLSYSLREALVIRRIQSILSTKQAVLHTHQFKVDYVFLRANRNYRMRQVTTIHGDYVNFSQALAKTPHLLERFRRKAERVFSNIDGIACISDHQIKFLKESFPLETKGKNIEKIYNGIKIPQTISLDTFGTSFRRGQFVFGMVARGIPEKGWETAIKAVLSLESKDVQLILVGEGPYLESLRSRYKHDQIFFSGFTDTPLSRIKLFDVGLLPSVFKSESLPTSIIEYMTMGKPVIATNVGEVYNMLNDEHGAAGIVLPVVDGHLEVEALADSMKVMIRDKEQREKFASNAFRLSSKFDMNQCVQSYLKLYNTPSTN